MVLTYFQEKHTFKSNSFSIDEDFWVYLLQYSQKCCKEANLINPFIHPIKLSSISIQVIAYYLSTLFHLIENIIVGKTHSTCRSWEWVHMDLSNQQGVIYLSLLVFPGSFYHLDLRSSVPGNHSHSDWLRIGRPGPWISWSHGFLFNG